MRQYFAEYLTDVDLSKRILEIGPLLIPLFTKDEANVYYADIRSTEEIAKLYENDPNIDPAALVPVDFVIKESYAQSLKDVEKFDYIMTSHVLEHIPRLIEFFLDIAKVMQEDGRFYALIPDHRYCFDHFRQPTSFAEAYYIHTQNINNAPWRVMDQLLDGVEINNAQLFWKDETAARTCLSPSPEIFAKAKAAFKRALNGEFGDHHFSVFTPRSFLLLTYNMMRAGLFPFSYELFYPTPAQSFTFVAVLRLCPSMRRDKELVQKELEKIITFLDHPSTR